MRSPLIAAASIALVALSGTGVDAKKVPNSYFANINAIHPGGSTKDQPHKRNAPITKDFTFGKTLNIQTPDTVHAYHVRATGSDIDIRLDITDNFGTLCYGDRTYKIAVLTTARYVFADDPSSKYWEYRFMGYDEQDKSLIYGWPQETDDNQLTLTLWGTPGGPIRGCWLLEHDSDTVRIDQPKDYEFHIPGTYTVPADSSRACSTFDYAGDYLRADCTGRIDDYDMILFGQDDFSNRGAVRIESPAFLTNGEISCMGSLWVDHDAVDFWPTLYVYCFDGKHKNGDTTDTERALGKRLDIVNATMPDWILAENNITKPHSRLL